MFICVFIGCFYFYFLCCTLCTIFIIIICQCILLVVCLFDMCRLSKKSLTGWRHWPTTVVAMEALQTMLVIWRTHDVEMLVFHIVGIFELFFSARQHICYSALYVIARPSVRPSVCLSVPLSVTRVDQSKTVRDRITQPSPQSSPMTLVSSHGTAPWNSNGKIGSGAPNKTGVWKIRNFQPISHRISETVQDRTKVTINH